MTGVASGVGQSFADTVTTGPLAIAIAVAVLAGLASFLSPCMLPLVPSYLSYITGLSGADLAVRQAPVGERPGEAADDVTVTVARPAAVGRGRVLGGSLLFVGGFTTVFVSYGAAFGNLGARLVVHQQAVERALGAVTVVLGLAFLGRVPLLHREARLRWLPRSGLAGAPLLGVAFGVGWTPCVGPTLGAVQTLAYTTASAQRGALLSAAYCLGLGLPFVLAGLGLRRTMGVLGIARRHSVGIQRTGGAMLIAVGLLLALGWWNILMIQMRGWIGGFSTVI